MNAIHEGAARKNQRLLLAGCAVLAAAVFVLVGLLVGSNNKEDSSSAGNDNEAKSQEIVSQVAELYILPKDETPTVAKLKDKAKLGDNKDFFKDAVDGDYVLVYQKAKVALIYREDVGRLVNVGPVAIEDQIDGQ